MAKTEAQQLSDEKATAIIAAIVADLSKLSKGRQRLDYLGSILAAVREAINEEELSSRKKK